MLADFLPGIVDVRTINTMRCQICKEKEATVHLTQFAGDKTRQVEDLCDECAEAKGINDFAAISPEAVKPLLRPETAS
jgi:protein-arginine kinase activator protein McsA